MSYKVILINDKKYDISDLIGALSWSDNVDTLGTELSFSMPVNYISVDVGDKIVVFNNDTGKETFRGIITDLSGSGLTRDYSVSDYSFYLNENKLILQFNGVKGSSAIRSICDKLSIPIGNIVDIGTTVKKIFKDSTPTEIISYILGKSTEETGTKYRMEMREGKFYIERYKDLIISTTIKLSENTGRIDVADTLSEPNISRSIKDMRNKVLITSDNEESTRVIAAQSDKDSISKYGLLQEVVSIDDKNKSKAVLIAKNKLTELNKVQEDITVDCLGDDTIRAGRIIELDNPSKGLSGKYLIKSTSHTYGNNNHKVSMTLGVM